MMNTHMKHSAYDADRPRFFRDVFGLENVVEQLKHGLVSQAPPQVYLFSGPTGVGKTTLSRIVARSKLCKERTKGDAEPCGQCSACSGVIGYYFGRPYEFSEYAGRDLQSDKFDDDLADEFLRRGTVVYLDEIQEASQRYQAFLLKAIEFMKATLIVSTTHPEQLNDALMNRLKVFEYKLKRPTPDEMVKYLKQSFIKLGLIFESDDQLRRIAEGLQCEMRPCSQFAASTLARVGKVTDQYLDEEFGRRTQHGMPGSSSTPVRSSTKTPRKAL